ncbi:GTPase HflX [Fusibacter sp. JL298sf-3]
MNTEKQTAVLVGLYQGLKDEMAIENSMIELKELTQAAGAEPLHTLIQNKERIEASTYIGSGKVEEVRLCVEAMDADMVIFNDELSGAQIRNLEGLIGVKILDRTALILDIFALRAQSKIAKLQVEYAQLRYRLPRLIGYGGALSRTGGGIGTRGPGEQKLEMDRRRIKSRMDDIRAQIAEAEKNRVVQRKHREKNEVPVVALVGYTNAGKSSVMNQMMRFTGSTDTEKEVFEKDMLFATLDTFARRIELGDKKQFVLTDTVGFVSKLPHSLVEAFKATLEEALSADLLLHVVDVSNDQHDMQMSVTEKVLKELKALDIPQLVLYNKVDKVADTIPLAAGELQISAKTGKGFDVLIDAIKKELFDDFVKATFVIPYDQGRVLSYLCETYSVENMDYLEAGTEVTLEVAQKDHSKYAQYLKG